MKVTLDSNAWERVFDPNDLSCLALREAFRSAAIRGFICDAAFRIEAITKTLRPEYFAQPYLDTQPKGPALQNGRLLLFSLGPDDNRHPGLPEQQARKLTAALASSVQIMRSLNWMGLPSPAQTLAPHDYVEESVSNRSARENRQIEVDAEIVARGFGRAAFEAADGWTAFAKADGNEKRLIKACAEWADGELVAAHIAYGNDLICTNDRGIAAKRSILGAEGRAWLGSAYGVQFRTLSELLAERA